MTQFKKFITSFTSNNCVLTIHKEIDDRLHVLKCLRPNVVSLANLNLSGSAIHILQNALSEMAHIYGHKLLFTKKVDKQAFRYQNYTHIFHNFFFRI